MDRGLIITYYGNGKGKTTADLGIALRAVGYDQKICMIQFIKENECCRLSTSIADQSHVVPVSYLFHDNHF